MHWPIGQGGQGGGFVRLSSALVVLFFPMFVLATAKAQSIDVGDAVGKAGETVELPISWSLGSSQGSGVSIDIRGLDRNFDDRGGKPACRFEKELQQLKEASATAFRPPQCEAGHTCNAIRIGVISFVTANNPLAVPSGELLRCSFTIPSDATSGSEYRFVVDAASYILPDGSEYNVTTASSGGTVRVEGRPQLQASSAEKSDGCAMIAPHRGAAGPGSLAAVSLVFLIGVLRRRARCTTGPRRSR